MGVKKIATKLTFWQFSAEMRRKSQFCDVEFNVLDSSGNKKVLLAHRLVMMFYSNYFYTLLSKDTRKKIYQLYDITYNQLLAVILLLYKEKPLAEFVKEKHCVKAAQVLDLDLHDDICNTFLRQYYKREKKFSKKHGTLEQESLGQQSSSSSLSPTSNTLLADEIPQNLLQNDDYKPDKDVHNNVLKTNVKTEPESIEKSQSVRILADTIPGSFIDSINIPPTQNNISAEFSIGDSNLLDFGPDIMGDNGVSENHSFLPDLEQGSSLVMSELDKGDDKFGLLGTSNNSSFENLLNINDRISEQLDSIKFEKSDLSMDTCLSNPCSLEDMGKSSQLPLVKPENNSSLTFIQFNFELKDSVQFDTDQEPLCSVMAIPPTDESLALKHTSEEQNNILFQTLNDDENVPEKSSEDSLITSSARTRPAVVDQKWKALTENAMAEESDKASFQQEELQKNPDSSESLINLENFMTAGENPEEMSTKGLYKITVDCGELNRSSVSPSDDPCTTDAMNEDTKSDSDVVNTEKQIESHKNDIKDCEDIGLKTEEDVAEADDDTIDEVESNKIHEEPEETFINQPTRVKKSLGNADEKTYSKKMKGPITCEYCGKVFPSFSIYERHLRNHTGERPFVCNVCNKSFSRKGNMVAHQQLHDVDGKKFQCQLCDSAFKTQHALKQHINNIHKEGIDTNCQQCDIKFKSLASLKQHINNKHGLQKYECPQCSRQFDSAAYLKRHLATHTDKKLYPCPKCDESFRSYVARQSHIASQHDGTLFVCEVCGKSYHTKQVLDNHCKRVHGDNQKRQCPICNRYVSNYYNHMRMHRSYDKSETYKCEECNKTFPMKNYLHQHMNVHKTKRFQCLKCSRAFTFKTSLKTHQKLCCKSDDPFLLNESSVHHVSSEPDPQPSSSTVKYVIPSGQPVAFSQVPMLQGQRLVGKNQNQLSAIAPGVKILIQGDGKTTPWVCSSHMTQVLTNRKPVTKVLITPTQKPPPSEQEYIYRESVDVGNFISGEYQLQEYSKNDGQNVAEEIEESFSDIQNVQQLLPVNSEQLTLESINIEENPQESIVVEEFLTSESSADDLFKIGSDVQYVCIMQE